MCRTIVCLTLFLPDSSIFFFKIYLFYFWLCWVFVAPQVLSLVAVSRGYSFVMVHGVLIVVASLVADRWL